MSLNFKAKPLGNYQVEITWSNAAAEMVNLSRDGDNQIQLQNDKVPADPKNDPTGPQVIGTSGSYVLDGQPPDEHTYTLVELGSPDFEPVDQTIEVEPVTPPTSGVAVPKLVTPPQ